MCLRLSHQKKTYKKKNFTFLKSLKKGVGDGGGTDPQIRIRSKMLRIPNTTVFYLKKGLFTFGDGYVGDLVEEDLFPQ